MPHSRRPTLLALTVLAALAGPVAAPAAERDTRTRAVAVQVVVPGAKTTQAGASGKGSYSYRDLVSVGSYDVGSTQGKAKAQATARASSVALLGGLVTAASASGAVRADGSGEAASGEIGGGVEGLVINGQAVAPGTSARFDVPGVGYIVTDERVVVSDPNSPAYRGFQVGLHLHLTEGWHDMPAGTEVLIGFADAGAQVTPEPRGGAAVPEPDSDPPADAAPAPVVVPAPTAYTPPPGYAPGDVAGYEDEGDLPNTQDPPPGGFTVDPPIDAAIRERMLGAGYLFPVAGGASFTNDFGAPRASTGFHQGIDLFGPIGTPLLAVTDGTLESVGWNGLGGHRLWLKGDDGTYFYYAHLSAYAPIARNGARVRAGEVVGFLGNSGEARTTPWHLHFEIHPAGKWAVAPFEYVSRWMGNTAPFAAGTVARRPPADFISPAVVPVGSSDLSSAFGLERASLVAVTRLPPLEAPPERLVGRAPEPSPADLLGPTPLGRPFDVGS